MTNTRPRKVSGTTGDGSEEREGIRVELDSARRTFQELLSAAEDEVLDRPSNGTRWTNRQLLFHMLFGYLVVRALLPLVKAVSRLPDAFGRGFVAVLNAATRPFNVINYWGSVVGSRIYRDRRMDLKFDAVIGSLQRHLAAEGEADMGRSMAYPVRWDPFFEDVMTFADVYRYPTQHFEFHRHQLTLAGERGQEAEMGERDTEIHSAVRGRYAQAEIGRAHV